MSAPVYLDYAATAAVRPPEVVEAVAGYLRGVGATPGRGGHSRALAAARVAFRCRRALAELFGAPGDPGRVVFQLNATHALNTALFGALRPGDAVVRTEYDHNAVRRPVAALVGRGVEERVLRGSADGTVELAELDALLAGGGRPARMLVLPHASNVLGSVLPVRPMAESARRVGALVLLDAAQTAGHLPVRVDELGVDLLAFTGHKGLLGPQGIGGLWVREGVEVDPLLFGGTGANSERAEMPEHYPDHLEAGTQNAPGMAGLTAGVEWVVGRGIEALAAHQRRLKAELLQRLQGVRGVRVCSPPAPDGVGIVTLVSDTLSPPELALRLEREHGVLTRVGLHCAPEAHRLLGTLASGAVRLSVGWATTQAEVEHAASALQALHA